MSMAAQEMDTTEAPAQEEASGRVDFATLNLSLYVPNAIGNSFAAQYYDTRVGGELQFSVHTLKNIYAGSYFNFYTAENNNRTILGDYDSSAVLGGGMLLGYRFKFDTMDVFLNIGGGYVSYTNYRDGANFQDEGGSMMIQPQFVYRFYKNLGVIVSAKYRHDFLKFDAPGQLESVFGDVDYLNVSIGLHISFGNY